MSDCGWAYLNLRAWCSESRVPCCRSLDREVAVDGQNRLSEVRQEFRPLVAPHHEQRCELAREHRLSNLECAYGQPDIITMLHCEVFSNGRED